MTNFNTDTAYTTKEGKIVAFSHDDGPESPRTAMDNLGFLSIKSDSNHIGCDEHESFSTAMLVAYSDGMSISEARTFLQRNDVWVSESMIRSEFAKMKKEIAVILPVYRYSHGGVSYRTTPFSCRWDSGRFGVVFALKKDIREAFSCKRITKKVLDNVTRILKGEVETYSQWANGEVYGIKVFESHLHFRANEFEESCWNFYFDKSYDFADAIKDHYGLEVTGEYIDSKVA